MKCFLLTFCLSLSLASGRPQDSTSTTSQPATTNQTSTSTSTTVAPVKLPLNTTTIANSNPVNCVDPKKYDCECLDQHHRSFCQSKHPAETRPADQEACLNAQKPDQLVLDQCPIGPPCHAEINNCACVKAITRKDCAALSPPATRPREFENCMNEPPTEKALASCPPTCQPDENDCECVTEKQKSSCQDLNPGNDKGFLDCLAKPAVSRILDLCPIKKKN